MIEAVIILSAIVLYTIIVMLILTKANKDPDLQKYDDDQQQQYIFKWEEEKRVRHEGSDKDKKVL